MQRRYQLLRRLKLSSRLQLLIGILTAGFMAYGALSLTTLDQVKVGGPVYQRITASHGLLEDIQPSALSVVESYLACLQLTSEVGGQSQDMVLERLQALSREFATHSARWQTRFAGTAMGDAIKNELIPSGTAFYAIVFDAFIPALRESRTADLIKAQLKLTQRFSEHSKIVDAIAGQAQRTVDADEDWAKQKIQRFIQAQWLLLLASTLIGALLALRIFASITRPLHDAVDIARDVAQGKLELRSASRFDDEVGQLLSALHDMAGSLRNTHDAQAHAENQLRRTKEMLERLIESASVMVVGVDLQGTVVLFNAAAESVTGYPRAELLGHNWGLSRIIPQSAPWQMSLEGHLIESVPQGQNQQILTKAGELRTIYWRNSVQKDAGSDGVALISFGLDFTDQLRMEGALLQAKQQAEAANQSKSDFLANMSHEIRTPMNAIIGMTGLALRTDLNTKQRNYLERVDSAAHGLLGLINDVLDFSKIEAGKLHFENRAFSLVATLDQLASLQAAKAQEKGLELLFDVAPELPDTFLGDSSRLGQVLLNLVSNALKFTQEGEIHVRVRELERGDDSILLQLEVQDTGIGLTAEQCARLFKPFEQADATTTRQYGGTGLGLSICRRLVEMMHGQIGVESEVGVGSRFIFTARLGLQSQQQSLGSAEVGRLRQLRVMAVDDNSSARTVVGQNALPVSARGQQDFEAWNNHLQGARILLVEDNEVNQELAREILTDAGMRVDVAIHGGEALHLVQTQTYDAVLMDWQMPVMDGLEATRRIRAQSRFAGLPIIAMTANALTGDRERCLDAGMNEHIVKPIEVDDLLRTLTRFVVHAKDRLVPQVAALPAPPPAPLGERPRTPHDPIPYLPGVDTTSALRRLRGNVAQYRKFLDTFTRQYSDTAEVLTGHLHRQEYPAAHLYAHSLKGMAAAIGADTVAKAAQALESALKAGDPTPLPLLLDHLAEPIAALLQAILQDPTRPPPPVTTTPESSDTTRQADTAALAPEVQQLARMLTDDDARALKYLPPIEALVLGTAHAAGFVAVATAARAYDFGAALHALQAWAAHSMPALGLEPDEVKPET